MLSRGPTQKGEGLPRLVFFARFFKFINDTVFAKGIYQVAYIYSTTKTLGIDYMTCTSQDSSFHHFLSQSVTTCMYSARAVTLVILDILIVHVTYLLTYLLTYYPVVRCNFNDMILLRTVYN